jgi:hypothetical protein
MNLNDTRSTGQLTEAELDARIDAHFPPPRRQPMPFKPAWYRASKAAQCCGDCAQGRQPCKTPQACRMPDDDQADSDFGALEGFANSAPMWIAAWVFIAACAALAILY